MSNFNCPECGTPIIEGENGHYITWCEHYPKEEFEKNSLKDIVNRKLITAFPQR